MTAFIGFSLIVLITRVLSLDSARIRSNIISPHKRLRRRHLQKQEEHEDSLNLSQKANFGSDLNLPSDYVMNMSCSSGYGSTIFNETIKEEKENFQDQSDKKQGIETEHLPEHITKEHTLKEQN